MEYVLGLDVGTTNTKAMIIDLNGNIVAEASESCPLIMLHHGWVEQNPIQLWETTLSVIQSVSQAVGKQAKKIKAIAISTQRNTMITVDSFNNPIRNAITWMDSRSRKQCDVLREEIGESRVYEITGVSISYIWTLAFILWIRDEEPLNFSKTACFGLVQDYLLQKLGVNGHFLDTSNACQTMLMDLLEKKWSGELMEYASLSPERLPVLSAPGTIVGQLSSCLAETLNMSEDVLLVLGAGDQQCAALGSGATNKGNLSVSIGTASNLLTPISSPTFDPSGRILCHIGATENSWVLETAMLSTGSTLNWFRNIAYRDISDENFYVQLTKDCVKSKPGAGGLILTPHFEGAGSPYWNPEACGILLGLKLSTTRGDIMRAIMEGISLEIQKNILLIKDFGVDIQRVIVTGGASKSKIWMQIFSDILNLPVTIPAKTECAALGACILAAIGSNLMKDNQFINQWISFDSTYYPNTQKVELYRELYKLNNDVYQSIKNNNIFTKIGILNSMKKI